MLPSGSIGGPECSLRYSALHQRDNSKCVCRGCYFYTEMPDPIPSAHFFFFFFLDPDYFLACPSLLSHPARPIQLIFSQSKYESTKINLSCFRIKSAVLLWWGTYAGYIVETLSCTVVFFCLASVPGRMLSCLCCQGTNTPHVGMCLCRHPTCCVHTHMWGPLVIPRAAAHWGLCLCVFTAPWACCLLTTRKTDE